MPVITIQFIKDVVATPEQKKELLQKMTETFVSVLGEVVRPYTYCIIQETPVGEWSIGGVPMPNLEFLVGDYYNKVHPRANEIMKQVIAQQKADSGKR